VGDEYLIVHAESLALRKVLLQIAALVARRRSGDLSADDFLEAVEERSEVFRHLELPALQEIIDQLEQL